MHGRTGRGRTRRCRPWCCSNDPIFVEAARTFAERVIHEGGKDDDARLNAAYRRALSRSPRPEERTVLLGLLGKHRDHYRGHVKEAEELLRVGERPAAKDIEPAELAAWTSVARAISQFARDDHTELIAPSPVASTEGIVHERSQASDRPSLVLYRRYRLYRNGDGFRSHIVSDFIARSIQNVNAACLDHGIRCS